MKKSLTAAVILAAASIALCAFLVGGVRAQEARSGGGAVSAQMVAEVQQLSTENTSLKTENSQLKEQLAAAQKDRDALKKGAQATDLRVKTGQAALARSNAQEAASEQKIAQLQAGMQQLIGKFRDLAGTLRKVEIEDASTKQTLAMRQSDLATCSQHNQALYKLDDEVLTHFERQGFFSRLASDEPFTQIKRTQLENFAVESRGTADDHKYVPPATDTPAKP
jgi:chromosome segregation ATPase